MTGIKTDLGDSSFRQPYNNVRGSRGSRGSRGEDRGRGRGRGRGDMRGNMHGRRDRAEFSSDRPDYDKSNTSIVVEKIPEEKFTEDDVRGFFSTFGDVVEVTMQPYKRLAIVKFGDWDSAKSAYNSPKVVFDNRFVKVYWYSSSDALPKPPPGFIENGKNGIGTAGIAPARDTLEPAIDIEEFTRKQQEIQTAHEEKQKKKQETEVARLELEKRREELQRSQAEEKRKLMEKLAAKAGKPTTPVPNGESKGASQTDALKATLAALEAEARSLGLDTALTEEEPVWGGFPARGRGRGRGAYRGRGTFVPRGGAERGGYRGRGGPAFARGGGAYSLDNRPKTIALTGLDFSDPNKDESLRQYLLVR